MIGRSHTFMAAVAATALTLTAACSGEPYDNSPDEPLKLSVTGVVEVDKKAQSVTIGVAARDEGWTMTGGEEWCKVSPASGGKGFTKITVAFAANDFEGSLARTATFSFTTSSGGETLAIDVRQLNTDYILPGGNPDSGVNRAVLDELKDWYYNGEPREAGVTADYNQSYRDFYFNYLSKSLKRNETFEGNVWAVSNERYTYSYIERNPAGTAEAAGAPKLNYGMEFDLAEYDGKLVGRILYVEQGSPADEAGLRRGDWFYKVNGTQLGKWESNVTGFKYHYQRFIDTLVHPIAGESPRLGMLSFRSSSETLVDEGKTLTLTPALYAGNPVLGSQVFRQELLPTGSGITAGVGYLMLNSFDPTYKNEIEGLFREKFGPGLDGKPLDSFILDLRYNKNGTVEMAELLGDLLVGGVPGVAGKTFARYEFDPGSPALPNSRTVEFTAHPDGIAVKTVFVLTSGHTAGASELLINALRGLDQQSEVKLVMIGEATQGLAAGMVKRTVGLDTEWEYSAWMLAFRCFNATGNGDYQYGLVPNSEVSEWGRGENLRWSTTWEWKSATGSINDPLIRKAVDMIRRRDPIPAGAVGNASPRQRTGFPREFCFPTGMTMPLEAGTVSNNR